MLTLFKYRARGIGLAVVVSHGDTSASIRRCLRAPRACTSMGGPMEYHPRPTSSSPCSSVELNATVTVGP